MKNVLVLVFFLSSITATYAQDTLVVSMAELSQQSLDKNLQWQLAQREIELADAELSITRAMYLPNIIASYSVVNTNAPMNVFGFKLNQSGISMDDFNPHAMNNPGGLTDFGTKLEFQQPIINMDAVYKKRAGAVKTEVLRLRQQRTKEQLRFELQKAYYTLQLAYQTYYTLQDAKATALANKRDIENYFKNGLVQKPDLLFVDVHVHSVETQIQFAESNVHNASDYLRLLLNNDTDGTVFKPADLLTISPRPADSALSLDENRSDLRALSRSLESYDWMSKSAAAQQLPRLNAFGSYELHDNSIYRFNGSGYLVGLQLTWNLFDGLKSGSQRAIHHAELARAKTELDQYSQKSELELKKAYRQVLNTNDKVVTNQKSWKQSQEAYRILKSRYGQGLEKSSDLLSSETLMAQKELEYYQAIYEYNVALAYYRFLK